MIVVLLSVAALAAAPPEERGQELALAAERADAGWKAERVRVELTVEGAREREMRRVLRLTRVEATSEGAERSLVVLEEPARHRGLKVLTLSAADGTDEVLMLLPSLGRVRRLVGRSRTGRFLGTGITFEDLGSRSASRYTHRWLRDDVLDGVPCHAIEAAPRDPDTGYGRLVLYRATARLELLRVDYYARDQKTLLKTGRFSVYAAVAGHLRPAAFAVTDAETGRVTRLRFSDYEVGLDLPPGSVTRRDLER